MNRKKGYLIKTAVRLQHFIDLVLPPKAGHWFFLALSSSLGCLSFSNHHYILFVSFVITILSFFLLSLSLSGFSANSLWSKSGLITQTADYAQQKMCAIYQLAVNY